MPEQQPQPEPGWPPRRTIVRLDPNLTDSPLRRALYDAQLRPITPTPKPTEQET